MPCRSELLVRATRKSLHNQAMDLTINSKIKQESISSAAENIRKIITAYIEVEGRRCAVVRSTDPYVKCEHDEYYSHNSKEQNKKVQGYGGSGGHVQYVDSTGDHGYTNGNVASYQYANTSSGVQLYSNSQHQTNANNPLYFDNTNNTGQTGSGHHSHIQNMSGMGGHGLGQIVASPGGGTYLIHQGGSQGSTDNNPLVAMSLSHSSRTSPATVQWLLEHFESSEGVSLPRALMYNHYLLHCREQTLDPVNAASYGKLVRSVFHGLRTRRLGTRGNSKYHYYGIRIKANSQLNRLQDEIGYLARRHEPVTHSNKRFKTMTGEKMERDSPGGAQGISTQAEDQNHQHMKFLGDASQAIPELDPIQYTDEDDPIPDTITQDDLEILQDLYREHCTGILDIIVNLHFQLVEDLWATFWRSNRPEEPQALRDNEMERKLPQSKLLRLSSWPPVVRWVRDCDHLMYQSLVEVLIPDVLRPIPSALTQAIRNFAKGLEATLMKVMQQARLPDEFVKTKLNAVLAFSQTLRRYTSLNHLAQAARAVLHNGAQISQMLADLNRVDFANVQEQASWVCQCDGELVKQMEKDFKAALSEQRSLEQWSEWLDTVVTKVLTPHEGTPKFAQAARQFLLKWCFYSSMVIRDLTLRSAASFGSFHLIRLLYDEYMFYLVEHRVAQATGETAIAVMSEFAGLSMYSDNSSLSGHDTTPIMSNEMPTGSD